MSLKKLNVKQQKFVSEYLIDHNGARAAVAAGYSKKTARSIAHELLTKPDIQAYLSEKVGKVLEKLEVSADKALEIAWNVATSDARDLVEYRIGCCRYCWGEGYQYQRTALELERDRQKHEKDFIDKQKKDVSAEYEPFDERGGIGYMATKDPNSECPECWGEGVGHTRIKDSRTLSPSAAALYAGVKQTKEGLEIKMNSKLDALEKVFKHLGMYAHEEKGEGALSIHIHI